MTTSGQPHHVPGWVHPSPSTDIGHQPPCRTGVEPPGTLTALYTGLLTAGEPGTPNGTGLPAWTRRAAPGLPDTLDCDRNWLVQEAQTTLEELHPRQVVILSVLPETGDMSLASRLSRAARSSRLSVLHHTPSAARPAWTGPGRLAADLGHSAQVQSAAREVTTRAEPVLVVAFGVLQHLPDTEAVALLSALCPDSGSTADSRLLLSHLTPALVGGAVRRATDQWTAAGVPGYPRRTRPLTRSLSAARWQVERVTRSAGPGWPRPAAATVRVRAAATRSAWETEWPA